MTEFLMIIQQNEKKAWLEVCDDYELRQLQPTACNGSVVVTDQEDIGHIDTETAAAAARAGQTEPPAEKLMGPDIISHTNGLAMKHRRKIIAIPVSAGDRRPQGYRELSYSGRPHNSHPSTHTKTNKLHYVLIF